MAKQSDKEIKQIVDDIFDDFQQPVRKMMERIWFRNILYYIGEQYIEWIVSLQTKTHPSFFADTGIEYHPRSCQGNERNDLEQGIRRQDMA
jgi:hypothetical protein